MIARLAALAVLSVVVAAPASAATPLQVCGRLGLDSLVKRCLAADASDEKALDLCNLFIEGSTIVQCVEAIGEREYSAAELEACGRVSYTPSRIECLAASGRRVRFGKGQCGDAAREALRYCRAATANAYAALDCLDRVLGKP